MARKSGENTFERVLTAICYFIVTVAFFSLAHESHFHFLQSKAALDAVEHEDVFVYVGNCVDCYEDRALGYNAKMSVTYYFQMDNGLLLKSIEALTDTSMAGFEKIKVDMQEVWTVCYVPVNIRNIEECWVVSIFGEDEVLISSEGVETALFDEIKRWRTVTWGFALLGMTMVACQFFLGLMKFIKNQKQKRRIVLKKQRREEQKARKFAKKQE